MGGTVMCEYDRGFLAGIAAQTDGGELLVALQRAKRNEDLAKWERVAKEWWKGAAVMLGAWAAGMTLLVARETVVFVVRQIAKGF